MATMKTLKFPGSSNVYEMVDATARAGVASLQTAVGGLVDDTLATSGKAADAAATGAALAEKADDADLIVLDENFGNVTAKTRNLWMDGDISIGTDGYVQFVLKNPLPAGTYTISCICSTTYTAQTYSVIRFSKLQDASAMSSFLNTLQIPHDGVRHPVTFTIAETAYSVRIMSATSMSASSGHTSTWTDIQVESGSIMTEYIQPLSAIDAVVREELEVEHHTGIMGPILEVAETYFNVGYATNDQLIYSTQHGPYSTPLDNGVKAIVCSQFALACLSGMKYDRSVYAQSTNQSEWWGYHSDGTGTYPFDNDYMINQYWVQYLSAKGLLIPYVAGHHNIKAGDLLFFGTDIAQNGGHCMIATQINPARICTIEATGSQTRLIDNAWRPIPLCITHICRLHPQNIRQSASCSMPRHSLARSRPGAVLLRSRRIRSIRCRNVGSIPL